MQYVQIGSLRVSKFILGSNPFSGFSHQGTPRDSEMRHYFSSAHIKAVMKEAESLGVNTIIGRADQHMTRLLMEYWDEGGTLKWFGQTCPEVGSHEVCIARIADNGARACYIHGGVMDYLLANNKLAEIPPAIELIRKRGLLAGVAGHNPAVFEWAEKNLDVDFYMCSYYNAAHRDKNAEHVSGMPEWFLPEDREAMIRTIKNLSKPVIHYKIMAAGRNKPEEAFAVAAKAMRPGDAVCVGIFPKEDASILRTDVKLLESALAKK